MQNSTRSLGRLRHTALHRLANLTPKSLILVVASLEGECTRLGGSALLCCQIARHGFACDTQIFNPRTLSRIHPLLHLFRQRGLHSGTLHSLCSGLVCSMLALQGLRFRDRTQLGAYFLGPLPRAGVGRS